MVTLSLRATNLRALVLWTSFACITSIQSAFTLDDVFNPAFVPKSVAAQWVSGADAVLTFLSKDGDIFAYTVGGTPWLLLNASSDVGPMLLKAERRVLACHSRKPSHFDSDMLAREPCVAAGSVIARYEVSADLKVRMPWLRVLGANPKTLCDCRRSFWRWTPYRGGATASRHRISSLACRTRSCDSFLPAESRSLRSLTTSQWFTPKATT